MLHSEIEGSTFRLTLRPVIELDEDSFFALCSLNRKLRLERTAQGEIVIMSPVGGASSAKNAEILGQLRDWSRRNAAGVVFDSSAGFTLPNGATRSPDASWVPRARLAALSAEQKTKFLPFSPDFVVELRSPSDRLASLQEKMDEYRANGSQLGWLIDPQERRVYVYRCGDDAAECLDAPATLSAESVLPGFVLDLAAVWKPSF